MAQIEHETKPPTTSTAAGLEDTRAALAGLDALELGGEPEVARSARVWSALWPKFAAVGIALLFWQAVVWSGWKQQWLLPGPGAVFTELRHIVVTSEFWTAVGTTMKRAAIGFTIAIILGSALAIAVSLSSLLRRAFGSFITGLQTMPSIVWFPLAILLFKATESAILFVVVLGAAPAIANGLITGVDHVPPLLLRAGRVLGARRVTLFRSVVLPAALPTYIGGLKQGWAFAWRSLMAGELLVIIGTTGALGVRLDYARQFSDTPLLVAYMVVILVIGLVVDALFGIVERRVRSKRGLAV